MKAHNTTTKTMRLETAAAKKPAAKKAKAPAKKAAKPAAVKEKAPPKAKKSKVVPGREATPHDRLSAMTKDQKIAAAHHMGLGPHKTGKDAHSAIVRASNKAAFQAGRVYSASVYAPFTGNGKPDEARKTREVEDARNKKIAEAHDAIDKALAPASAKPATKKAAAKAPKAEPAPVAKKPTKKALGKGLEGIKAERAKEAPPKVGPAKKEKSALAKNMSSVESRLTGLLHHGGIATAKDAHAALKEHFSRSGSYDPTTARINDHAGHKHLPAPTKGESLHAYMGRATDHVTSGALYEAANHVSANRRGHSESEAGTLKKKDGEAKVLATRNEHRKNMLKGIEKDLKPNKNHIEGFGKKPKHADAKVTHVEPTVEKGHTVHRMTIKSDGEASHAHAMMHAVGSYVNAGYTAQTGDSTHMKLHHPTGGHVTISHDPKKHTVEVEHSQYNKVANHGAAHKE